MEFVSSRLAFFADSLWKLEIASRETEEDFMNCAIEVIGEMDSLGYCLFSLLQHKSATATEVSKVDTAAFRAQVYPGLENGEVLHSVPDGNCYFYALSNAINGIPDFCNEYRVRTCLSLLLDVDKLIQSAEDQVRGLCPKGMSPHNHSILALAASGCSHYPDLKYDYVDQTNLQLIDSRTDKEKRGVYVLSDDVLRKLYLADAKAVVVDKEWTCISMIFASTLATSVDLILLQPRVSIVVHSFSFGRATKCCSCCAYRQTSEPTPFQSSPRAHRAHSVSRYSSTPSTSPLCC